MATPYSPTTPTPAWPPPATMNQHRSSLTGKRKAEAIVESNEIDSTANSSISSQFKKLRLNQRNLNHSPNLNAHYSQQQYQHPAAAITTPTGPTASYRPHLANTDVRPATPSALSPPPPPAPPSTPVPRGNSASAALATSFRRLHYNPLPASPGRLASPHTRTPSSSSSMAIDDTPNRIIINDLEAEIAEIEADEAAHRTSVFIPDIDKKVSAIPQRLLQNSSHPGTSTPSAGLALGAHGRHGDPNGPPTALILYKDPTSISVPEAEDVVRKTIIAARQRAREKAVEDQRDRDRERERFLSEYRSVRGHGMLNGGDADFSDDAMTDHSSQGGDLDDDPDAMEIE